AVIIAHGLRGDRNLVRLYGTMFYNLGCDVLGYDFAPRNNPDALLTYGYEEKSDLAAVVDWLTDYTALPKSRIGIWGGSYGAATTLQLLAEEDELAWVIADSSFASMPRLLDEQAESLFGMAIEPILPTTYFIIERRLGFDMDVVSPEDSVIGNDVPLLLLHSTADELIYAQNSQAIYANTNPETTRLIYMDWGSAHMQSYIDNPETYTHYVYAFLRKFAPDFSSTLTPQQSLADSPRIDQATFIHSLKQQIIPHTEPITPDMSAFIE
ncbi:MAG: prolyl oligopeptidase family serine peptidase, partial [Chloroflexota bacterium]